MMNDQDQDDPFDSAERVQAIKTLFRSVCSKLQARIAAMDGDITPSDATAIAKKLTELESAHVALVKAEEAFHDRTKSEDADSGPDYAVIRAEIGRALDRIRDA